MPPYLVLNHSSIGMYVPVVLMKDSTAVKATAKDVLPGLSLRVNFSWTFVGNVVYAGCQWGMLMVLAKLGSPEMVGQFALGLAVTAPIMMLTNLQLRAVQATDARKEYQFGDYLGLRLISTVLALLIIIGIVLITGYRLETALVVLVVGLAKAFESVSDVFYGLLQQHERMDRIAQSMMIKGFLSLTTLGIIVYLTGSVLWGALGLALAWALILIGYDVRSGALMLRFGSSQHVLPTALYPRWEIHTLARLSRLALPLGIAMMLISLNTNIPRYFIERRLGEYELGIFAALAYLMVAGNTVIAALGQSASPRLAKHYAADNFSAFYTLLFKLICLGMLLGAIGTLVALVAGREILTLLYRPEYAKFWNIFLWLVIASGIGYVSSFLGYGITATRMFHYFIVPYAIVTMINLGLSIFLIPAYGLQGAAWTIIITNLVSCVMPMIIFLWIRRLKQ